MDSCATTDRTLSAQHGNHDEGTNGFSMQALRNLEDSGHSLGTDYGHYDSDVITEIMLGMQSVDIWSDRFYNCHQSILLAIRYINEHYMDDLSLSLIAQEVYLSPSYFATLFKKTMGISFVDYLTLVRITRAKWLLHQHGLKIYQISERVGFKTSRYFVHVFKQHVGIVPSEYRDMCWKMQNIPKHYYATVQTKGKQYYV